MRLVFQVQELVEMAVLKEMVLLMAVVEEEGI